MKISFVIPLFNCLDLTKACVASLQATLPRGLDHEIILVDDGSTDGTREWLEGIGPSNGRATPGHPFRVLLNERNLGYAASNNLGAREAAGDVLGLLNNDLVFLPGWLPPMLRYFRPGRRTGFVGNIQIVPGTGAIDHSAIVVNTTAKPEHRGIPSGIDAFRRRRPVLAATGACALVKRKIFLELGGFDEGFVNGGEDIDFCLRARAAGLHNWVAMNSRVLHHVSASPGRKEHDERNSRRLATRWREELVREGARTWCKHYVEANWNEPRDLDPRFALRSLLAAWDIVRDPPATVVSRIDAHMRREEQRWNAMFDGAPDAGATS